MNETVAIIDLGTNTFHLLIARISNGGYEILLRERLPVKIGMGGIINNLITDDGLSRALAGMMEFRKLLDQYNISKIRAVGTSALRNASNGYQVIRRIVDKTGIEVDIISGDREAEYIYKGVRAAVALGGEKSLILDIGGGSVEFIIGNASTSFWKQSVEIGAQRLLETFQKHDPITPHEMKSLDAHFEDRLKDALNALKIHNPITLVGSSGTFDTLSEIFCLKNNLKLSDSPETPLSLPGFHDIYHELISQNREQRMKIPGMIEMRVDMIVVACCLIRFLLNHHPFENIRVSTYSMKEGVLAELLTEKF